LQFRHRTWHGTEGYAKGGKHAEFKASFTGHQRKTTELKMKNDDSEIAQRMRTMRISCTDTSENLHRRWAYATRRNPLAERVLLEDVEDEGVGVERVAVEDVEDEGED